MKTNILKFTAFLLMIVVLFGVAGCDKQEIIEGKYDDDIECKYDDDEDKYDDDIEFCSDTTLEIHKAISSINNYLSSWSENWNHERKLNELVYFLNSRPYIADAKLVHIADETQIVCRDGLPIPQGTWATITMLLNDNGKTREVRLSLFGERNRPMRITGYAHNKPKEVHVYFNSGNTTIREVFDFINLFDHRVLKMWRLGSRDGCILDLNGSRVTPILNALNAKPYLYRAHVWWDNFENRTMISVIKENMKNRAYQSDWLRFMSDFNLTEGYPPHSWFIIIFEVPDGEERKWKNRFNEFDSVIDTHFTNVVVHTVE